MLLGLFAAALRRGRLASSLLALSIAFLLLNSSFLPMQTPTSPSVRSAFLLRQLPPQRARQSRYRRPLQSRPRRQPLRHQACSQPCLCLYQRHPYPHRPCLSPQVERNDAGVCKPSCQQDGLLMHCRRRSSETQAMGERLRLVRQQ
jgi:hypothetical protein